MTENNAAQAAEQDPLSDAYVNAVIRQHGYGHPTAVAARLWQWIGLHGGENGVTLLIYEAHKALSKLRAEGVQAGDERAAFEAWAATEIPAHKLGRAPWPHEDQYNWASMEYAWSIWRKIRAALASAPVAGERFEREALRRDERLREAASTFLNAYRARYGGIYGQIKKHAPLQDQVLALVFASREAPPSDDAAPQASEAVRNAGIELAAAWVDKRRHDFDHAHGYMESDTGAWSFGRGDGDTAKEEYSAELAEIAEGLRALKTQADKDGGDCAKGAGDEPIAWESTTPIYFKFITDSRYRKFSPAVRKWYRPYRCSTCAALSPTQPTEQGERDA